MKRWMWKTDKGTWCPVVVCPYCSTALNPIVIHLFNMCPLCQKRVHPPKKDYWEEDKGND